MFKIVILAGNFTRDTCGLEEMKVGACFVNPKKRIVGTGYNGMPNNCSNRLLPWGKDKRDDSKLGAKDYYVCHAEMNGVINRFSADLDGCTIYVSLFPCNECAKIIIQSGIKEVVYYSDKKNDKEEVEAAKILFEEARVKTRQYDRRKRMKVEVDFESIEAEPQPRKRARKE
ncbi:deoxycytidylate deaminase-like [Haliotis rubra]|uniref:deoxycytidylate deaminase-like n=1 Tax=Haliotis rubra TaxID=36100 RepID=UPI001EE5DAD9|nr:deoxycytidylate deaminase-like [Haliotis rubra]